jgi:dTDP-glucose pyrophosphorylase
MKDIFIYKQNTIFETLEKLQKVGSQCLVVVNKNNLLLGTISDGDLRKAILKNNNLNSKIEKFYNKHCYKIKKTDTSIKEFSSKMKNYTSELNSLHVIPIVDKKNKVVDLIHQDVGNNMSSHLLKNLEVVIMAGGLGTRLRPYTNILPKPLIPYNDKTIIENIIDNFLKFNLKNFYISINYKNYLISSFFKELNPKYKIKFLYEKKPLGTAGVLQKLKNNKEKLFIVTNCDSLIDINLIDLVNFHRQKKYDLTIVSSSEIYKIPYGVCKIVNNKLSNIIEKPQSDFLANTGFYLVNSKIFDLIKKNESLSFVDLIKLSLKKRKKIGVFPISSNNWKDLGQSISFKK